MSDEGFAGERTTATPVAAAASLDSGRPRRVALTRDISPAIVHCELTHLARVAIDVKLARAQHDEYERCLADLGYSVERLEAGAEMPDSVFIEDIAVVFDEVAIITRPGARSRRVETPAVVEALRPYRKLITIEEPATLDGGDVLAVGRRVFVGVSNRTNPDGIMQLRRALMHWGYSVEGVNVRGCLHLKSAVTALTDHLLLVNRQLVPSATFDGLELLDVHPDEPLAANALRVGETVIYPDGFPRTRERIDQRGLHVAGVSATELAKAEGGVTCCSLLFVA